jgi:hypothetical protein
MFSRLSFLLAIAGCAALSSPSVPPIPPSDAAITVKADLADAAENAGMDSLVADESWARAYDGFELQLESEVRQYCGRRIAAEIEYGFGTVRAALDRQSDAIEAVVALQSAIDHCLLRIP